MTTPNFEVTTTAYDLIGRVDSLTAADGGVTDYTYDALYLTQIEDAIGQTYDYTVNALGWATEREDPRAESDLYEYDVLGRVTEWTDRRGLVTTYEYDVLGNLELEIADGDTVRYHIDPGGDFWVVENGVSLDSLALDDAGRVTSATTTRGAWSERLDHTYDDHGRRTEVEWASTGSSIGYGYGASGQLDSLTAIDGQVTTLSYNADLQRSAIDLPLSGSSNVLFEYPSTHRPATIDYGHTVLDSAFALRMTQDTMRRTIQRRFVGVDTTRYYSYEDGRLIRYEDWAFDATECSGFDPDIGHLCVDENEVFSDSVHYDYDLVGNRTDHSATIGTGNRLTAYDGYTLAWDDAGFLTSKTGNGLTQTFYWNARGQLDSVTTNGVTSHYEYDGLGRRVETIINGSIRRYMYDGDDVFAEFNQLWDTTGEFTTYPGTDRLHSAVREDTTYYFATDEKGTVTGIYEEDATIRAGYAYDPWGRPEGNKPQTVANSFRYLGRQWDWKARLVYLRARHYDPEIGRFISEDPIGLAGGINPFAYASGDPVNRSDRFGLTDDEGECDEDDLEGIEVGAQGLPPICVEVEKDDGGGWHGTLHGFLGTLIDVGTDIWRQVAGAYQTVMTSDFMTGGPRICGNPGSDPNNCITSLGVPWWAIATPAKVPTAITGYAKNQQGVRHGLHQAISRDAGRGVSPAAILGAIRSPVSATLQRNGRWLVAGRDATIVVTQRGELYTAWSTSSRGWRGLP